MEHLCASRQGQASEFDATRQDAGVQYDSGGPTLLKTIFALVDGVLGLVGGLLGVVVGLLGDILPIVLQLNVSVLIQVLAL